MESYPEFLLVGVSPLVFAVNAISDPSNNDGDNSESTASQSDKHLSYSAASSPKRGDFDRFLDAMASSLAEESEDGGNDEQLEFPPIITEASTSSSSRNVSLFRPDDDDLDDASDDDLLLDYDDDEYNCAGLVGGAGGSTRKAPGSNSIRLSAFGLSRRSSAGSHSHSTTSTSYAKALQHGQGFFQRARIVSISTKHGFPPSKDPEGNKNIVFSLKQARSSPQKVKRIFSERPIQGILPAGWLEKHVYALPSVVLVVVKLSKSKQAAQDSLLLETVENLHYSLVPKRPCKIHVVCLVDDNINVAQAQQWSLDISRKVVDSNPNTQQDSHLITLLRAGKDLKSGTDGFATTSSLKRLQRSLRQSSLAYYLHLRRRAKEKLGKLSEGGAKKRLSSSRQRLQPPKELLPLAIRYCFKIAMFYEFQLKFEKSLKFMAEAYRYTRLYYHHLVRISARASELTTSEDERRLAADHPNVSISTGDTEDMEVALADTTSESDSAWIGIPPPPSDMAHQCLTVADWLNFKLLQAGFGSHTEGGLFAADSQWRQHARVFCARRFLGGHPIMSEEWYFWRHVAHQRLVMCQLVERHPPRALGDFGNEYDELLLRCAPWRAYEAAAEACLKAGASLKLALAAKDQLSTPQDDTRAPFVGGLDNDGLLSLLEDESNIDHKGRALELVLRAISMFEHEWGKEKLKDEEDQFPHRPWGRFGARLYFLAGGILMSNKQWKVAMKHLEQAANYCAGWGGLEVAVRRLLAECYEKVTSASWGEADGSQESSVLATIFNAKLSPTKLLQALRSCSSTTEGPSLQWFCESFHEVDGDVPFSFSVTFPMRSHATAGDSVVATVFLESNLDYAVVLESVILLSMAGQIVVPAIDFAEHMENFVVVEPRSKLRFSTKISLPKNLEDILADDGSEKPGKNSYTKSARPRTAGITAAAGARLAPEAMSRLKARSSNAQWSLNFLGGKPLRTEGIRIMFRAIKKDADAVKSMELTIEKKNPKTPANIKRTPFEEDNYIASSWSRPFHLPLPDGPRCLRVLEPASEMEITNMTQDACDGRAVEGTVNRICLKLQGGPAEKCSSIQYMVKCSSTVVTEDVINQAFAADESPELNTVCSKHPKTRTPILVEPAPAATSSVPCDFGYDIPVGWKQAGSGQTTQKLGVVSSLTSGESTLVFFELYRPLAVTSASGSSLVPEVNMCQTDFEVIVSYSQQRQKILCDGTEELAVGSDMVSQKFCGSVTWTTPISLSFERGSRNVIPCGSRHPSNLTDDAKPYDTSVFNNIPIIDGENVDIVGNVKVNAGFDGCKFSGIEIVKISFEENGSSSSPCNLMAAFAPETGDSGVLSEPREDDPCRLLKPNSNFAFALSVKADMKNRHRSATFPLGLLNIEWLPQQIELPKEVQTLAANLDLHVHGPLALSTPISVKFLGPVCYIERAPFQTTFECTPPVPRVSDPFEVVYNIRNDTENYQKLSVALHGQQNVSSHHEILVCGLVNSYLRLGPFETQKLSYTAIATKPGMTVLPEIYISSERYNSWVVKEGSDNARPLCVLP